MNIIELYYQQIPWQFLELVGLSLVLIIVLIKGTLWIIGRIHSCVSIYPKTKFGFKGKLVYTDDSPNAEVFVSLGYKLSAKPDFIFKVGFNRYVVVEYKSRKGRVKRSDINQLKATVIACRSKYKIVAGYIVTNGETKVIECGSTWSLYRDIKKIHKMAQRIKHRNYFPKLKKVPSRCAGCGYTETCMSETRF